MAFGIGRAFKKGWKKTFGKVEDAVKPYVNTIAGATIGAIVGGPVGFAIGATAGYSMDSQAKHQEDMINAQLAAADKIAAAQNAPILQSAATPTASIQEAQTAEMNGATAKRKAFGFANTRRTGSVARRNTLG
jgi:hypothetical protein